MTISVTKIRAYPTHLLSPNSRYMGPNHPRSTGKISPNSDTVIVGSGWPRTPRKA